ncbi:MAG TPA: exopolysaccharide biosynthesis polyprenyl glycosylphosphotransferase [Conexibacter sp.]|nr:exopolysaccharide biosynthesis polyprenyl glycosylphosphotransferase [Conexibacter sp.]
MASALTQHLTADPAARPSLEARTAVVERRRRRTRLARLTYRTADAAMLLAASVTAIAFAPASQSFSNFAWGVAYALLTLLILEARGFYDIRLQDTPVDTVARIFAATSIAAMTLTALRAVVSDDPTLTGQIVRLWAFALVFLGAGRVGITLDRRRALRRGETGFNTLIIGAGSVGHLIARRLRERPEFGLRPIGFLDKDPLIDADADEGLHVLGASWDLEQVVQRYDVEQVVVTFSTAPHAVLLGMIRRCRELGVEVVVVPRLFEEVSNRVEVEHLGGVPLLRAATVDPRGWQFGIKYAVDRILAALALLVASPLLLALALAVRLSSPGPILFRQRRVGLDGREFDMLKFRSMRVATPAAEQELPAAEQEFVPEEGCAPGGVEGEDRRTRVGEVMRRLSLDELPQLLNVLRGDMALVGPRPERTSYVRAFEQHVYRYGDRHRVKSGLTGWAQVQGLRGQTPLADRVEWDNYYIENWSLWFDLKIMLMTVPALLGRHDVE